MHVLQLGPYPPPEGGITRNMLAIREELWRSGHTCSIIAIAKSSRIRSETDVYHPRSPFALLKLLCTLKYDILHLHIGGEFTLRIVELLALCGAIARRKSVLTIHSGGFAVSEHAEKATPFSLLGIIFRTYERVICVNTQMLALLDRYGVTQEKVRLIYPFICRNPAITVQLPDTFKEFNRNHHPVLLTVGLLEDTYDLFMQIDALEKIRQVMPEAGLIIVGSGSLEEDLRHAISAKTYRDHVFLAGDVEHAVTLHLINECDLLLRTTKFDGDAISIREALHLGTPVIATDNHMRPEGVFLIPIHNADALVETIVDVAGCTQKARNVQEEDRSNIEAIVAMYKKMMGRSGNLARVSGGSE